MMQIGPLKDLEESEILLVIILLLGLQKIKLASLEDVPGLELEKLEVRSFRNT